MNRILTLLRNDTRLRYVFIGGTTYLIEVAIILLAQAANTSGAVAVAISFWVGLGVSFILQKIITFRDHRFHRKVMVPQVLAYVCLVIFNFCFTLLVVGLFEAYIPVIILRSIALAITVLWNYYLYTTWIFKDKEL